ncbi:MAG: hypothetical protein K8F91_15960, partial [Candidatus Obscuribacterales bacterium]|nr:hypothetical protein [Candidatus Obscuribacterales bacterium]
MQFSKSVALAILTFNSFLITGSAEAGETRLKRPTVLFGSAQKHHQDAEPAAVVNTDSGVLQGNADVESLFPTRSAAPVFQGMAVQRDSLGNRPLTGKLSAQELALLSKRELIVFIDKSFSMNERDCPHVPGEIPVVDRSAG